MKPIAPERYDLAFEFGGRFLRVQCKWATRRCDVVTIYCYSSRRGATGLSRKTYSANDIDLIVGTAANWSVVTLSPQRDLTVVTR